MCRYLRLPSWPTFTTKIEPSQTLKKNLTPIPHVNTWSNYSFVFFGSLLIALGVYSFQNKDEFMRAPMSSQVKKNPSWLIYHGILLIWGGLGSFAFHASFTEMAI